MIRTNQSNRHLYTMQSIINLKSKNTIKLKCMNHWNYNQKLLSNYLIRRALIKSTEITIYKKVNQQTNKNEKNIVNIGPITWQQFIKHNKSDDLWVCFKGQIFDVTDYAYRHPGGSKILQSVAGNNIQEYVYKYHPWINISYMAARYKVGFLCKK